MNTKRWMPALGLVALAAAAGAVAQTTPPAEGGPKQTAEGAQKFLAAVVKKGYAQAWFVDAQGRTNHVRGKALTTSKHIGVLDDHEVSSERAVEKQLSAFVVTEIDTQASSGKQDACVTRITKWDVREPLTESRSWNTVDEGVLIDTPVVNTERSTYELSPELASPHGIEWRNVKLGRSTNGTQMTVSFKDKSFITNLAFVGEVELIDRIEYAMKFLKLSCDDTTATGF